MRGGDVRLAAVEGVGIARLGLLGGSLEVLQQATPAGWGAGVVDVGRSWLGPEELTAPRPWPSGAATLQPQPQQQFSQSCFLMGKTAGYPGKTAGLAPAS